MRRMGIAFVGALLLAPAVRAEQLDSRRMHRDLGIAEAVLTHLQGGGQFPFANPVRGVYLKGYGAVFLSAGRNRDLLVALMGSPQEQADLARRAPADDFGVFKAQTTEFFRSYADAIGQVGEEERVTVLSGDLGLGGMGWGQGRGKRMIKRILGNGAPADSAGKHKAFEAERPPKPGGPEEDLFVRAQRELAVATREQAIYEGSVKKADLRAWHRGRLGEEEFAGRVTWKQHPPDPAAAKQVDIMAGILEKALVGEGQGSRCSGVYRGGLGALFFVELGFGEVFSALAPPRIDRTRPVLPQISAVAGEQRAQLKEELVRAVAEYGHTLPLKSGEPLVAEVQSGGPQQMSIHLLLRVRQEDLAAYRKGELSLEEFGQRVEFEE